MSDADPEKPHEETDAEIRGSGKDFDRRVVLVQRHDPANIACRASQTRREASLKSPIVTSNVPSGLLREERGTSLIINQ